MEDLDEDASGNQLTRREALGRAARLGGAIAWAVPLVQTVDIRAAAALAGSGEPKEPPVDETGGTVEDGGGAGGGGAGGGESSGGGGGGTSTTSLEVLELTALPNPLSLSSGSRLQIGFSVSGASVAQVMIVRGGRVIRQLQTRELSDAGLVQTRWSGRNRRGKAVSPGRYQVVVQAADARGNSAEATFRVRVIS